MEISFCKSTSIQHDNNTLLKKLCNHEIPTIMKSLHNTNQ